MTTRRGFLGAILAAGMAPAIAKAGVLMPVRKIWTPLPSGIISLMYDGSRWHEVSRSMDHDWPKSSPPIELLGGPTSIASIGGGWTGRKVTLSFSGETVKWLGA